MASVLFLFCSFSFGAEPAMPLDEKIVQIVPGSPNAPPATVIERADHTQVVSWQGARSIGYDQVELIKFDHDDLLFRARQGDSTYFTLAVLPVNNSRLFVMADDPANNVYLDWHGEMTSCQILVGEATTTDGRTYYVTFDPRVANSQPNFKIGPSVNHGKELPSHMCWIDGFKPVLVNIVPKKTAVSIQVWYDPSI